MSSRRPYFGPSDSQSNADALARRGAPYSVRNDISVRRAWDYRTREPGNLREAEHYVRKAYSDEVPTKLHEGPDSIGEGGTPKMTTRAEGYLFGHSYASDARRDPVTGEWDAISYFASPFRAALDNLKSGHDSHPKDYVCIDAEHKRGLIVQHVAIGGQGPVDAAVKEGVPSWCAKVVAEHVLRAFLRNLSDVRVDVPRQTEAVA